MHMFQAAFLVGSGMLCRYLINPDTGYFYSSLNVARVAFEVTSVALFVLAALHMLSILDMVRCSYQHGELAFHTIHTRRNRHPKALQPHVAVKIFLWLWRTLWSEHGLFGVHNPWFETIFAFRETAEVISQVCQAYLISYTISRAWINNWTVGIIVLNCFSGIFTELVLRNRVTVIAQRLTAVMFDFALDLTFAVVVPLAVLLPYWLEYDPVTRFFPLQLVMNDVWYTNAVTEVHQVLVTSWLDFVGTLMPHVSLLSCLGTVRGTLRRSLPQPTPTLMQPEKSIRDLRSGEHSQHSGRSLSKLLHIIRIICGFAVLTLHISAKMNTASTIAGCRSHVSAWLATNYSCSVFTVNCYREGIDGHADTISPILEQLEQSVLRILVVSHCPNVTVPTVLQTFPRLQGLEFYNCSLTEWSENAAVHSAYHDVLSYVYFAHTEMTELPPGILHRELPSSLLSLGLFNTTLPSIPSKLPEYWREHTWNFFGIENSSLNEVPASLGQLPIVQLGLSGNNITSLPVDMFTQPDAQSSLQALSLSLNPLTTIPTLRSTEAQLLMVLYLESTLVRTMPEWMVDWIATCERRGGGCVLALTNSPICNSSDLSANDREDFCERYQMSGMGSYPMPVMEPQRPL
ncbi:TPA: hypothetical protein N0F65_000800 [Lagenidium giganteum]|uniref:Uncharacterized protein n=1 Tax=Lagenidium giganteum TaxID=4803 RepID=A0AAV2ZKW2_9STRA|nr:TPA: hypothetical protein N0F65_000800 [Lagenidium giganteum]